MDGRLLLDHIRADLRPIEEKIATHVFPGAIVSGSAPIEALDEPAISIIQDGLDHGVKAADVHRAARLFQAYEKLFWDTMASAGTPAHPPSCGRHPG